MLCKIVRYPNIKVDLGWFILGTSYFCIT